MTPDWLPAEAWSWTGGAGPQTELSVEGLKALFVLRAFEEVLDVLNQ